MRDERKKCLTDSDAVLYDEAIYIGRGLIDGVYDGRRTVTPSLNIMLRFMRVASVSMKVPIHSHRPSAMSDVTCARSNQGASIPESIETIQASIERV